MAHCWSSAIGFSSINGSLGAESFDCALGSKSDVAGVSTAETSSSALSISENSSESSKDCWTTSFVLDVLSLAASSKSSPIRSPKRSFSEGEIEPVDSLESESSRLKSMSRRFASTLKLGGAVARAITGPAS